MSKYLKSEYLMTEYLMSEYPMSEYLMSEYLMSEYLMSEYLMSVYLMSEYPMSEYLMSEYLINVYLMTEYLMSEYLIELGIEARTVSCLCLLAQLCGWVAALLNRPISRVVIGREVDYRSRLIYVRYCLTSTTLCLWRSYDCTLACNYVW